MKNNFAKISSILVKKRRRLQSRCRIFYVNSPKNSRNYSDFTRPKLCDTPNHGPAYLTLHVVTVTRRAVRDDRRDPFRVEKQFNK